ncbi:MAG TPA: hypothetical protein VMP08_13410 [Anaerolineae bacterium]|nr:hypothetical protein [Anaerolineae bacterium]
MNTRFVVRGTVLALGAVLAALAAVLLFTERGRQLLLPSLPPDVPPVPTLTTPRGALPTSTVGLVEWSRYGADDYHPVGRGFFFRLSSGQVAAVTTAHSVSFSTQPPLENIALARGEWSNPVSEFNTLRGDPGNARTGEDMTVDYVLLSVPLGRPIDPELILDPDPRGLPQPGERVTLYSLINDQAHTFQGAVLSAEPTAVWVVMDDAFDPSGLSGSPFVSQHTGKVIGMAIATTKRGGKVLLGLHPINSLVAKAEAAQTFPKIADYRR